MNCSSDQSNYGIKSYLWFYIERQEYYHKTIIVFSLMQFNARSKQQKNILLTKLYLKQDFKFMIKVKAFYNFIS